MRSTCNGVTCWLLTSGVPGAGNWGKLVRNNEGTFMPKLGSSTLREQWVFKGGLQGSLGRVFWRMEGFQHKRGRYSSGSQYTFECLQGNGINRQSVKKWYREVLPTIDFCTYPHSWGCMAVGPGYSHVLLWTHRLSVCVKVIFQAWNISPRYFKFFWKSILDGQVLILVICQLCGFKAVGFLTALTTEDWSHCSVVSAYLACCQVHILDLTPSPLAPVWKRFHLETLSHITFKYIS